MDLVPWRPFKELTPLRKEVDNLLKRFLGESPLMEPFAEGWLPSADVSETDDSLIVRTELPGMEAKDIEVSISGDRLLIKGEKKKEEEKKEEQYHRIERYYGSFQRSFRLPANVQTEKIEANFEKGILKIVIPKTEEAPKKPIKIEVK